MGKRTQTLEEYETEYIARHEKWEEIEAKTDNLNLLFNTTTFNSKSCPFCGNEITIKELISEYLMLLREGNKLNSDVQTMRVMLYGKEYIIKEASE